MRMRNDNKKKYFASQHAHIIFLTKNKFNFAQ